MCAFALKLLQNIKIAGLVKYTISLSLLLLLYLNFDSEIVLRDLRLITFDSFLVLVFVSFLQLALQSKRWHFITKLQGSKIKLLKLLNISFVGIFFGQFLPSSVGGDIVKILQSKNRGLSVIDASAGVVIERVLTLLSVCLVCIAIDIVQFFSGDGPIQPESYLIFAICTAILSMKFFETSFRRIVRALRFTWAEKLINKFVSDIDLIISSPTNAVNFFMNVLASQFLISLAVWYVFFRIGLKIDFSYFLLVTPFITIASAIPISIAGWGAREFAMIYALSSIGVAGEQALVVSIALGFSVLIVSLPGVFIFLFQKNQSIEPIRSRDK